MDRLQDLLSRHAHRIWRGTDPKPMGPHIATGYRELDALIGGGWPTGDLVEVMTMGGGLGKSTLLLPALATLTQAGKVVSWLPAHEERPYAPTLHQNGVDLSRVIITASEDHHQRLWATELCLRNAACGAVVLTETRPLTNTQLRRFKLAAASAKAIGFVLRDENAVNSPSPASLRIRIRSVQGSPQRQIFVLKCSGHPPRSITLDINARSH